MGSRLKHPESARQKFYAPKMEGGFRGACFYGHRSVDLTEAERETLLDAATRLFDRMPSMSFLGAPTPVFLYVDMADEAFQVGMMLLDQTGIGYERKEGSYGVDDVVAVMEGWAKGFLSREDNIPFGRPVLDDPGGMLGGIHAVGRVFSDALNLQDFGCTGRGPGSN